MTPMPQEDDEDEMTRIMSAEERSRLQESARGKEGEQRPTARPFKSGASLESEAQEVPKAPPVPDAASPGSPKAMAPAGAGPVARRGLDVRAVVAFVLLVAAVALALALARG